MTALIIVDVQYDFVPGGALAVPDGDKVIPVINEWQSKVDLVVATQDWHPAGHKSFASSHADKKPFDQIKLHNLDQVLWPDHCVQGSAGAELHAQLNKNRIEAIFRKGMDTEIDSYSGFYDNGHKKSTGLAGYLRERKIDTLYICGLAGDYCVYYTAKDALAEGFRVVLLEKAIRSINTSDFEKAKADIQAKGGECIGTYFFSA